MKKLFILSIVALLSACGDKLMWRKDYNGLVSDDKTSLCASEDNKTNLGDVADIYSFEYKNHKYIMFKSGTGLFVIHDPECNCKK